MRKRYRTPVIGPDFDQHQRTLAECVSSYCDTLAFYRPRGFSKLAREGRAMAARSDRNILDALDHAHDFMRECDDLLTDWARRVLGHDYVAFGPFEHTGDVGFYYLADSAAEDADLSVAAGDPVPRGFSGLLYEVTDHGNVTVSRYSRGRRHELFSCV